MSLLNIIELNNIKKMLLIQEINYEKYLSYSEMAVDPQINQIMKKAAQESLNIKQKILDYIKM